MKKKIMIGVILSIFMLVTSSAIAVTIPASLEENLSFESTEDPYVDPEIYLTNENLGDLYESLQYIDDPEILLIVQEIIDVVENKGYVNAQDIQDIENDLGLFFPIHTGLINSYGEGIAIPFPGGIIQSIFCVYIGPAIYVSAYAASGTTTINGIFEYTGAHDVHIIGFFGCVGCVPCDYSVTGICGLIFVNSNNGGNVQSDPQSNPTNV